MRPHDLREKKCTDCNISFSFEDFWRINPSFSLKRALELWDNPIISIYCPDCYFKRPEKPFKVKRGYFNYYSRFKYKSQ